MATKKPNYYSRFADDTGVITEASRKAELDKMKAARLKPSPSAGKTSMPGEVDVSTPSPKYSASKPGATTIKSASVSSGDPKTVTLQSESAGYFPAQKKVGAQTFYRQQEKDDDGKYTYAATVSLGGQDYQIDEGLAEKYKYNLVKAAKSLQDKDKTEFEKVVDTAEGKTLGDIEEMEDEVLTDAEEAKLKVDHYDYEEFKRLGEEMGLDVSWLPESQDEFIEYYQGEKKKEMDYLLKLNTLQKEYADEEVAMFDRQTAGAIAATTAGLAQGREGVMSATSATLSKEFTREMDKRRAQLIRQYDQAEARRQKAEVDLKKAQQEGDIDQIESYQARLQAAEREISDSKTQMIEAAALQAETAMNILSTTGAETRANMESFTGMVDQGIEMDNSQIISMAETLRIPASVAMNYYTGAQTIRDDVKMDAQTKAIELADLSRDFTNKVNGIRSEEAKAVQDFQNLMASGNYTDEEIATYAAAMNIPDELNPYYQADLAYQQAKSTLAVKEANGIPITAQEKLNMIELYKAQAELRGADKYIPSGSVYEVSDLGDGIYVNVEEDQALDNLDTKDRDEGQCGAFVNDVFGTRIMEDLYTDKMKLVDESIIVPLPGMAFVKSIDGAWAKYGHTGIVEQVNADGTMQVVDANKNGHGKVHRYTMNISDVDGFVVPPNSEYVTNDKSAGIELTRYMEYAQKTSIDDARARIKEEYPDTTERAAMLESFNKAVVEKGVTEFPGWFTTFFPDLAGMGIETDSLLEQELAREAEEEEDEDDWLDD